MPTPLSAGGVGMYIDETLNYKVIEKCTNEAFQTLWIEIIQAKHANIIRGVIYRQHNSPERFQAYFEETIEKLSASGKPIYVMSDFNINLLRCEACNFAQNFLQSLQSFHLIPTIDKPTRVHTNSATLIDNIFFSNIDETILSGNIVSDISDHYSQFCISRSENVINHQSKQAKLSRDFRTHLRTHFSTRVTLICTNITEIRYQFFPV